jgi:hypothetical protein
MMIIVKSFSISSRFIRHVWAEFWWHHFVSICFMAQTVAWLWCSTFKFSVPYLSCLGLFLCGRKNIDRYRKEVTLGESEMLIKKQ